MRYGGLGVDLDLFDRHVARLEQLGYANGAAQLTWPFGRMMLHRGDPDLSALGWDDLREFREAIDGFTARLRLEPLREFYARAPAARPPAEVANGYFASSIAKLHAVHVLLFHIGQVQQPPTGRINAGSWVDHLAPDFAPPKIRAVLERYLRLHLQANLDRPQTVRHVRDALRRLVTWMAEAHPEMTSLAELHREHAEEFLRWLGTQTSQHTGAPLSVSFRRSIVTLITRFVTETAAWGWDDVPARVLFSRADIPKITHPVPRFIPDHELAALMTAVDELPDPYQRAALIVARWSGARRDEIRRLAVDCLDTYPDGHPRLRIPVGKGYAERSIPLHPQAAEALQPLIELARQQNARSDSIPAPAGRCSTSSWCAASCCPTHSCSTCHSRRPAPPPGWSTRPVGRRSPRTGSGTPSAPSSPKAAPASRRSWPCSGHRTPNMSIIYSTLSDPTVKQQYQDALDRHLGPDVTLAGPAAEALREHRLDPEAVSWLQTNFLKTELELGHCLRTPAEGPVRVRPGADLLEVPHHQRLRAAPPRPSRRRTATHRRRHRPRLAA